jgi:AraC-like DNA-binding protein
MSYTFTPIEPTHDDLKPVFKFFFAIEFKNDDAGADYLLPNGLPSFFYIQSAKPVQTYFGESEVPIPLQNGFYIGYCDTVIKFTHEDARVGGVAFYPTYFSLIFGKRLLDIMNLFVRIEEPPMLDQVKFLITDSGADFTKASRLFDQYLLHQLNNHPLKNDLTKIYHWLMAPGGYHLRVEELAERLGYSTRHLNSIFRQYFGMSPKHFIKMVKFNHALKYIYDVGSEKKLASIAHEVGYHDQSHFIRDFKSFCGKTPKELVGDVAALASKFRLF